MDWTFDQIATDHEKIVLRLRAGSPPASYRTLAKKLGVTLAGARKIHLSGLRKQQHLGRPAVDEHSQHPVAALVNWAPDDYAMVTRVMSSLMRAGVVTFEQLAPAGADEILELPNIGRRSLQLINQSLGRLGMGHPPVDVGMRKP